MQDSPTSQEPPPDPTPEGQSGSTLLLIPRRRQIPKRKFKGFFMGMGEDGRVGLLRNLLRERLRWLLPPPPPPSRVPEPHSCLGPVLFYLLRVLSGVMASRRSNANDSGSTWPPFRGKKKSCNVLSATLIRETHREPVAWRQLSSWYLPCMLITSPPGSESALSLGWWQ